MNNCFIRSEHDKLGADFKRAMKEKDEKIALLQNQLSEKKMKPRTSPMSSLHSEKQEKQLIKISSKFCNNFTCDETIVNEMFQNQLIRKKQREELLATPKSETVHSWMLKASVGQVIQFKNILERNGQPHIAALLSEFEEE